MATISIRNLDEETVERFNRSARARGMSQGEYLEALVALHAVARQAINEYMREFEDPTASSGKVLLDGMEAINMLAVEV